MGKIVRRIREGDLTVKQHLFWRCRDCNSYHESGVAEDGTEITLDYAVFLATFKNLSVVLELYCPNCGGELKGYFHVPPGQTIVTAHEGRVEVLTTFVPDDTDTYRVKRPIIHLPIGTEKGESDTGGE